MSEQRAGSLLRMPVKGVFALELRQHADILVARIVGFKDEDQVPDVHVPPLPNVVEANSAPYRRLLTDAAH